MFLDSTVTYQPVETGGVDMATVPSSKTVFTQTTDTVLTERVSEFDGTTWQPVSEIRITNDALGREKRQLELRWNDDTEAWVNYARLVNFHRGTSLETLDSFYLDLYNVDSDTWERLYTQTNKYDDGERLVESAIETDLFGFGTYLTIVATYVYNDAGDNDVIRTGIINGADTIPGGRTELTYEDHRVTEELLLVTDDNGNFVPDERNAYTYTSQGLQDSITMYQWDDQIEDWMATSLDDYDYENGLVTDYFSTTYTMGDMVTKTRQTTTYLPGTEYVDETKDFEYEADTDTYVLTESTTYFYSEVNTTSLPPALAKEVLRVWPNPAVNMLRIDFEEPAVLHLFDQSGRLLFTGQHEPGHGVDLGGLPSGVYIISLTTRNVRHQARVIKG
ncbi:MAG: T9SS type A sorting domain-containing protein [Lewinella sp.]